MSLSDTKHYHDQTKLASAPECTAHNKLNPLNQLTSTAVSYVC